MRIRNPALNITEIFYIYVIITYIFSVIKLQIKIFKACSTNFFLGAKTTLSVRPLTRLNNSHLSIVRVEDDIFVGQQNELPLG